MEKRIWKNSLRGRCINNFDSQSEKEIKGNRYAVILSPHLFNANTGFGYEIIIPVNTIIVEKRRSKLFVRCYINKSVEKFRYTISTT